VNLVVLSKDSKAQTLQVPYSSNAYFVFLLPGIKIEDLNLLVLHLECPTTAGAPYSVRHYKSMFVFLFFVVVTYVYVPKTNILTNGLRSSTNTLNLL
jgi:hypothetical protein